MTISKSLSNIFRVWAWCCTSSCRELYRSTVTTYGRYGIQFSAGGSGCLTGCLQVCLSVCLSVCLYACMCMQVCVENNIFTPANVVSESYVFTGVCLSMGGGGCGVLSQHALQVVSQHALQQVSGLWYPSIPCSFPRSTPKGEVEEDLVQSHSQGLRGVWSRPTPKGEVGGDLARGLPALGGVWCMETPTPHDGYCCRRYASCWNALLFTRFSQVCVRARDMCVQVSVQIKKYITRCWHVGMWFLYCTRYDCACV